MARDIYLIANDVRSVHNVGSLFRTADAAGTSKIFLVGITPTPIDRFGKIRADIHKTALGAETTVPWEYRTDALELIGQLKRKGIQVVALEQSAEAKDYRTFSPKEPFALLVGNEVAGVPSDILHACDTVIEIPQRGKKESLNVAVAAGIALFRIRELLR